VVIVLGLPFQYCDTEVYRGQGGYLKTWTSQIQYVKWFSEGVACRSQAEWKTSKREREREEVL